MYGDELKKYYGKKIKDFFFSDDRLRFTFEDDASLDLFAQGECCSTSWFEAISGEESLAKGAEINEISLIGLGETKEHCSDEIEKFYGLKIKTDKGYADIDMRNMSNGYYGGDISINEDLQYGGDRIYDCE